MPEVLLHTYELWEILSALFMMFGLGFGIASFSRFVFELISEFVCRLLDCIFNRGRHKPKEPLNDNGKDVCPKCLFPVYDEGNYCPECGQGLKW